MSSLLVTTDAGIMTVTINRPERRNAANWEVWTGLERAFDAALDDRDVRVLVVTGAGGAFCSGQDLNELGDGGKSSSLEVMRRLGGIAKRLQQLPKPTIAKVGGVAAGAGANLAFLCDLVVASAEARFIQSFSARGLSPDFGGSWLLPRLVGLSKAKELALLAAPLSASEAMGLGLVNRVVPAEDLDRAVDEWATRLAAGPPQALGLTKALLNQSLESSLDQALESEAQAQTINLSSKDLREAVAAFREKRPARFEGR
jgi:enoyl-CoA hydratase/carnithine racemase